MASPARGHRRALVAAGLLNPNETFALDCHTPKWRRFAYVDTPDNDYNEDGALTGQGSLLDLLQRPQAGKVSQTRATTTARDNLAGGPAASGRRLFLVEFEILGDVRAAADATPCTMAEVREW